MNNYSLYDIFFNNNKKLDEAVDFYSQKNKTISVYHLTGHKGIENKELDKTALSITGGLDSRGNLFKPGHGDMYGRGLYTCYKLNRKIASVYGNTLLEFKLPVQNCLVFVGDEAEAIHGANSSLDQQFLSILQRKGIDYQSNEQFNTIVQTFASYLETIYEKIKDTTTDKILANKERFTSGICLDALRHFSTLTRNQIKLKHLVDGVIFIGGNDGPVCVVFNTQLAAINRIGKVVPNDVKIFERPSDIGIDDFDSKTFNQLRRLYSAKSGKGSKEWRAHQRELVNTLNQNISMFSVNYDEKFKKEVVKQISDDIYRSLYFEQYKTLSNEIVFNAGGKFEFDPPSPEKELIFNKVYRRPVVECLVGLKIDVLYKKCYQLSRLIDTALENSGETLSKAEKNIETFYSYLIRTHGKDTTDEETLLKLFDLDDELLENIKLVKQILQVVKDIFEINELHTDDGLENFYDTFPTMEAYFSDEEKKKLNKVFVPFEITQRNIGDKELAEIEKAFLVKLNEHLDISKNFYKNYFNILLKELKERYDEVKSGEESFSPEQIVELIKSQFDSKISVDYDISDPQNLSIDNSKVNIEIEELPGWIGNHTVIDHDIMTSIAYASVFEDYFYKERGDFMPLVAYSNYSPIKLMYLKESHTSDDAFNLAVANVLAFIYSDRFYYHENTHNMLLDDIIVGDMNYQRSAGKFIGYNYLYKISFPRTVINLECLSSGFQPDIK